MSRSPSRAGPQRSSFSESRALPHLAELYSAALSLAGDPVAAQELAVEAFARAYATCSPHQPAIGLRVELYRSLATARRQQRQEASRTVGCTAGRAPVGGPASLFVMDPVQLSEDLLRLPCWRVRRAISQLSEDLRFTVCLADVAGFSCQQIADITGVTAMIARARLRDGHRELLRRLLNRSAQAGRDVAQEAMPAPARLSPRSGARSLPATTAGGDQ